MSDAVRTILISVVVCLTLPALLRLLTDDTKPQKPIIQTIPKFDFREHVRRAFVSEESGKRFHGNIAEKKFENGCWNYFLVAPDGKSGWWKECEIEHDDRYDRLENWKGRYAEREDF